MRTFKNLRKLKINIELEDVNDILPMLSLLEKAKVVEISGKITISEGEMC